MLESSSVCDDKTVDSLRHKFQFQLTGYNRGETDINISPMK